jgi:hypothetical protein
MSALHQLFLYVSLGFLGLSLLIPGLTDAFRVTTGQKWLVAADVDATNHLRALNGMMAAVGVIALLACWDLAAARPLVTALGTLMEFIVVARVYSIVVDGVSGIANKVYLGIEAGLSIVFFWLAATNEPVGERVEKPLPQVRASTRRV